jgi:hypothetical protein
LSRALRHPVSVAEPRVPIVYCICAVRRWRWSKSEGAHSAPGFRQSCARPPGGGNPPLNVAASSNACASVYCRLAANDPASRRRNWTWSACRDDRPPELT